MAFFSRYPTSDIGPLFRLLDDSDLQRAFDTSALSSTNNSNTGTRSMTRSFAPRFDARETKDAYHLEGELPGVKSKDLDIEFTDPHTLIVRGTSSRESHITNEGGQGPSASHKATVEDVPEEGDAAGTVTKQNNEQQVGQAAPTHRYWIAERSVGSFHRNFNFPARVDQDGVRASLREGILSITVPKINTTGSKKIQIE